jgi:exosome complex component RRP41
MTPNGDITLMQMDGRLSREQLHQAVEMAMKGCKDIYEMQRKALMDKYSQLITPTEVPACE